MVLTYVIERAQAVLPWNPQHLAGVGPDLAWNTAASFTTNTNWQFYTPESTMSYLTEMAGLATHNFFSAAVGIVVAVALVRAIKRTSCATIGNFWVDTTRTLLYILLPGFAHLRAAAGSAGRPAESACLHGCAHARGPDTDHRTGTRGFTGSHQDARHEWRRILQRQQRSSVRESDAVLQLPPDPLHLHHSRRA